MWNIAGKPTPIERFGPFEPVEVLYEFDGPRIFTLRDADDELNLVYWSDEDDTTSRYVVVPTTARIVAALKTGSISVFDALNQPRCWLCDTNHQGELTDCQRIEFEEIPRDSLPAIGTMLLPTLVPLPPQRNLGAEIVAGQIAGNVIRNKVARSRREHFDLRETIRSQQHKKGLAAIIGKWPGDESDDEIVFE